ncbi:MAG: outer membrane beta-barrel protein, partial [Mucinivorans sp.]
MKKILLLFVASLLCMGASAQKLISFGPKVGTNISFASGSADIRGGKAKLNAGLFIEVRPIKPLGVCLEVNYSGQEFSLNTYQDNGVALTTRYNLGYLEIPALVNLYLWRGLT